MTIFNGKVGENAFVAELRWKKTKRLILLLSFLMSGLPIGIAGGMIAYTISAASMGAITSALVAIGIISMPVFGPIAIGAIVAAISTVGVFIVKNNSEKKHGSGGPGRITDLLELLGVYVAKIVFIPVVGFAICDGTIDEGETKFIADKMGAWGYSNEYITKIINDYINLGIDGIKTEIINTKNIEGGSRYIRNNANLKELYNKSYNICYELRRKPDQQDSGVEKINYLDWLCYTLDIPRK